MEDDSRTKKSQGQASPTAFTSALSERASKKSIVTQASTGDCRWEAAYDWKVEFSALSRYLFRHHYSLIHVGLDRIMSSLQRIPMVAIRPI